MILVLSGQIETDGFFKRLWRHLATRSSTGPGFVIHGQLSSQECRKFGPQLFPLSLFRLSNESSKSLTGVNWAKCEWTSWARTRVRTYARTLHRDRVQRKRYDHKKIHRAVSKPLFSLHKWYSSSLLASLSFSPTMGQCLISIETSSPVLMHDTFYINKLFYSWDFIISGPKIKTLWAFKRSRVRLKRTKYDWIYLSRKEIFMSAGDFLGSDGSVILTNSIGIRCSTCYMP